MSIDLSITSYRKKLLEMDKKNHTLESSYQNLRKGKIIMTRSLLSFVHGHGTLWKLLNDRFNLVVGESLSFLFCSGTL